MASGSADAEVDKAYLYLENIIDCLCEITAALADKDDEALQISDEGILIKIIIFKILMFS